MWTLFNVLAQMDPSRVQGDGTPQLTVEYSYATTWIIAAVLTAGILLITFKTSKRNHLESD